MAESSDYIFGFVVVLVIIVVVGFFSARGYEIMQTKDGMLIDEYSIKDTCLDGNDYEVLVSIQESRYEHWYIPSFNKYIISNESKIIKLTQISKTEYIIYYPEIRLCRA